MAHNLRSAYNVGALLRTAEVFAVEQVYFAGFTPYPVEPGDTRDPELQERLTKRIGKTALGTEHTMRFAHAPDVHALLRELDHSGYRVTGLEMHPDSVDLRDYEPPRKTALLLGEEVKGISAELLAQCSAVVQVPMYGLKDSLNVSVATGIALYALRAAATTG